ncbi:DNA-cytosine methyltransferase [Bathymodiolus heckerae thiotrophic gill symbiont]|uniref:DNA (cytosine-5-)-methyltransferase n=1 Tax=Bathymodiolus heckerae thiotrophic gill symbiont TaxID=1052212 RepID=UPI0010B41893|nr:DNA (cytosine-5-)-methyltransferase [Bathymodiolus heckerae thiotrophic gill symbiont]CAC9604534.1 DNA-cytosine methyltransferase (EC 2.1.1.37) [uncultured Gammaproteobacteria bacterium]SHN92115.1 DNA-cytosine methyltransferase [Bathymodiolus heckerae thiotrophic gill symbiont]
MIKTIELFAGVGGFRLGLERSNEFKVVWSNQYEPLTKIQHASDVYKARFPGANHSDIDIAKVIDEDFESIPDHDLLVGGFPCQDYSVARTLKKSSGIQGKKGVLWWSIHAILKNKTNPPKYLMLENVDRLLKSPVSQRGRDFAIMLASLSDLGYVVEWRVINAADYGMPQRRKRVYIMAYKSDSDIGKEIKKLKSPVDWITNKGVMQEAFPMQVNSTPSKPDKYFVIEGDLDEITNNTVDYTSKVRPFDTIGVMIDRKVYTDSAAAEYKGKKKTLGSILEDEKDIPVEFFISKADLDKWAYLKGAKKEERTASSGHVYYYSEGPVTFPDALDRASRTIVTGEGGKGASRFKHVVETPSGRLRRLTPVELERLNMFPDNHTEGATDAKRAFFMGNALVVGVVERLGKSLASRLK